MASIASEGSRETSQVADPGKRIFFRKLDFTEKTQSTGAASRREAPVHGRWLPEAEQIALPGDVFWCVWQPGIGQVDQTELVIAGDDGAILHRVQGLWKRYQTAERLPIHALCGYAATDLYAVGWMGQVLHFDGMDWHKVRGAQRNPAGKWLSCEENTPLFAICGNSAGEMWAVGDHGHILHFNGSEWQTQRSGTTAHLRSVILLPDGSLLAAGTDGTVLRSSASRDRWSPVDCGFSGSIQSVLLYHESVLLAGGEYSSISNCFEGRLMRVVLDHDLDQCRAMHSEHLLVPQEAPRLRHLSQRTDNGPVFIVGDGGFAALLEDKRIVNFGKVVQHDLLAGTFADELGWVAMGDFGTLLINDFEEPGAGVSEQSHTAHIGTNASASIDEEPQWRRLAVPTRRQLWAVAIDGIGRLCCCGDGGVVLRLAGNGETAYWESMGAPTDDSLHCLVSDGRRGFYVAGQMGRIRHHDGERWTLVFDLELDITITAFYSPSPDCIFAVGDEGLIVHWDGCRWQRMSSGTKSALYGIWGLDAEHVLAVGDFGLVLRWNGEDWREFHVGTEHFLFGVWGSALDNIHVVGLSGTLGFFDGTQWQLTPARAREDLLGICEYNGELFAVGVNGVVLRRQETQWIRETCETDSALRAVCGSAAGLFAVGDQGQVVVRR